MYKVTSGVGTRKHEVQLLRYNKNFSKKPIQQLAVVPVYEILIRLSGKVYTIKFKFVIACKTQIMKLMPTFKIWTKLFLFVNSVSDNIISVHDMSSTNFSPLTTLQQTKGATLFTHDVKVQLEYRFLFCYMTVCVALIIYSIDPQV